MTGNNHMNVSHEIQKTAARILIETGAVLINTKEPFTYISGKIGPVYVDCRRLLSFPNARTKLMDMGADVIRGLQNSPDYIAGGETAGIPYAAFLSERLNKPMLYVRKKPKGYGRGSQIEGFIPEGEAPRVLIAEDMQNFGVSVKVFVDALRAAGAVVSDIFVIFSYGHESSRAAMADMGVNLHALTGWQAVIDAARETGYCDAATLESVAAYLKDPERWKP